MLNKIVLIIIYLLVCNCSNSDDKNITQPSSSIAGCIDPDANNYNSNATTDDGSCTYIEAGDHPINSLWLIPNSNGSWGIGYNSDIQIGGFQITINGATIISVINGGDAQNSGFTITANEGSGIILGFSFSGVSIPVGSGILFSLELDGTPTEISNIIISDDSANSVIFTFDPTYFSSNLEMTGISKLTIFSSSITTLEVGDEVGIFDSNGIVNYNDCTNQIGELLVGTGVWQGEQLEIVSIGSVDYCDIGEVQLAGFQLTSPMIIKIWDVSEQSLKIASPEYSLGSGIFSDVLTVISGLNF
jgi:hypothetical protein